MVIGPTLSPTGRNLQIRTVSRRAGNRSRRGTGVLEYTLLVLFFTGLVIATLGFFGRSTANTLDSVASSISAADSQAQSGGDDSGEIAEGEGHGGGVGASRDGHGGGNDGDNGNDGDHGNNGVGNGEDGAPPGNPQENDGEGSGRGNPGARGGSNGHGN